MLLIYIVSLGIGWNLVFDGITNAHMTFYGIKIDFYINTNIFFTISYQHFNLRK